MNNITFNTPKAKAPLKLKDLQAGNYYIGQTSDGNENLVLCAGTAGRFGSLAVSKDGDILPGNTVLVQLGERYFNIRAAARLYTGFYPATVDITVTRS